MKIHPILITAVCLCVNIICHSQNIPEVDKGDKAFDNFDFDEALYFYEVAHETFPSDPEITRKIADTYRRMGQISTSAKWYRKTLVLDASKAEVMLYYAEALKNEGQYDEAIYWYEMYDQLKPGDPRAKSHLADKYYYRDLFADTARYEMKRLKINNDNPAIGLTLFEDEKLLVSAVNLDKSQKAEVSPYLDVYLCDFNEKKELSHPVRLEKKVNSKYHDGPAFYSFAEHRLYITRTNMRNGKPVRDKNGNVNLKLYSSEYKDGQWSSAQELKINDDGYSTGHASLSKDGQTLYFVSTKEGGYGGSDIYQCFKTGNSWSDPINLGSNVNTPGNEMFPFPGEDGNLYFASDGHAGLGGLDVFYSPMKNEVWQHPINLGSPINTAVDDFALVYDKESDNGYFCSNRSGNGDDDIYFYKHRLIDKMTVAGTIKASSPNISLVGERIQIKKLSTGESSTMALDEFERFEYAAEAGEKIEITFINAEYFDPQHPAVSYQIPELIDDPYVNIGQKNISLKKIPPHDGQLLTMEKPELATVKNTDNASSQTNTNETGNPKNEITTLDATSLDIKTNINDGSELSLTDAKSTENQQSLTNAVNQLPAIDKAFAEKIAEGDRLFQSGQLQQSKAIFMSAHAMQPDANYPKEMISKIENMLEAEAAEKAKQEYQNVISSADLLFASCKNKEALVGYHQAMSMTAADKDYVRSQIEKAEKIIAKEKEDAALSAGDRVAKKHSEFDAAIPVVDLTGMSIDNVIFDYNKALIRKEDMPVLDQVLQIMKDNPGTVLLIRAHCDSRGSLTYNQSLSMSRAMAVQGYLMQKGIKRDRLVAEWFGEQRPLNGCVDDVPCAEGEYEVNRRAEFKLVNKN